MYDIISYIVNTCIILSYSTHRRIKVVIMKLNACKKKLLTKKCKTTKKKGEKRKGRGDYLMKFAVLIE